MKKLIFHAALATAIGTAIYLGFRANSSPKEQLSDVMLANIEALAVTEHPDYKNLCNTHCWNKSGYVCYLNLSTGATLYCDEMVHWTYFP